MKIGEKIKYYREKKGYSQKELAEKIHVSIRTIGHYETGTRTPHLNISESLAKVLHISVSDFFKEIVKPKEKYPYFEAGWVCQYNEKSGEFQLVEDSSVDFSNIARFYRTSRGKEMIYFYAEDVSEVIQLKAIKQDGIPYLIIREETIPLLNDEISKKNQYVILWNQQKGHHSKVAVAVDEFNEIRDGAISCKRWNELMDQLKKRDELLNQLNISGLHIMISAVRIEGKDRKDSRKLHEYAVFINEIVKYLKQESPSIFNESLLKGFQLVHESLSETLKQQSDSLYERDREIFPETFYENRQPPFSIDEVFHHLKNFLEKKSEY